MSKVRVLIADQPLRRLMLPAALSLGAAIALGTGATYAQDDEAMASDGIDGTWTVDTAIGSFDDYTNSWVGFRVAEVLDPGGDVVAVGRTPGVSGQLDASGTVIEDISIEVDLTGLVTDNDFRNGAIQRALGTGEYPTATFVSSEPVDLGELPAEGEPFDVTVPGTLTVRDVSQEFEVQMQAGRGGETVVVVGSLPVDFTSFDVTMPTAPIVVSVEDSGDLEWQIFFTRGADEMADEMAEGEAVEE